MSSVSASGAVLEAFNSLQVPVSQREDYAGHREDLASSGLWRVDLSWSAQAPVLRQMAIASPNKLTLSLFVETLQNMRIVDKKVTEVDAGMLQYRNLEELTLTGNLLETVRGEHLPPQLKVLELCYNQLLGLGDLDCSPPSLLQHLGVGYNHLSSLHLTHSHWDSLLSLDLSYNHLYDLSSTLHTLTQLKTLRSLQLVGNPLTLVPCYHGYTVDTLSQLSHLDDSDLTVRDRKEASGMVKYCNNHPDLVRIAQLEVEVSTITGLPELLDKGSETEDQIVRYLLQVTHTFLPQKKPVMSEESGFAGEGGGAITAEHSSTGYKANCFKPALYPSPVTMDLSPMTASYHVENLTGLTRLLQQGIEFTVLLQKVVYTRDTGEGGHGQREGAGKRTLATGKGTTSTQGGRSSVNKTPKPDKKSPLKGKAKPQSSVELPGEGWHPTTTNSFLLGSCLVDTTPLLRCQSKLACDATTLLQTSEIRQEGLIQNETVQENQDRDAAQTSNLGPQILLPLAFTVKQCNSVSDLSVDNVS